MKDDSWKYNGSNDYMTTGASDHTDGSTAFWVKAAAGNGFMFGKNNAHWYFTLQGNYVKFRNRIGNPTDLTDSSVDMVGTGWHHVVATVETNGSGEANDIKLYIDGTLVENTNSTEFNNTFTYYNAPFQFGRYIHGILYGEISLDEVACWSTELTADEVTAIYNSGAPIDLLTDAGDYESSANLRHYWRMGDGDTYPTIEDRATNETWTRLDATMYNMAEADIESDVPS